MWRFSRAEITKPTFSNDACSSFSLRSLETLSSLISSSKARKRTADKQDGVSHKTKDYCKQNNLECLINNSQ